MNLHSLTASSATGASAESQPLTLREGQMIHGKVQQLLPGQMAQVQVGNHQLYAKLEVPMQAGDAYYFKVNSTEPELSLQVISGPMRSSEGQAGQLAQLMESLNLPKTAEMKEVLASIIKLKIPMTKENLVAAATLLKSVPEGMKAQALAVIGKMAASRMPMTANVFQSMLQVQSGTIAQQLGTLNAAIQNETNLAPAARQQAVNTLQALANPLSDSVGKELLSQSLSKLLDPSASKTDRFTALQLLKSADILPARTSLANLPQQFAELITRAGSQAPTGNSAALGLPQSSAAAMQTLLTQLSATAATAQQEVRTIVQSLAQQLNSPAIPEGLKQTLQTQLAQFAQQPANEGEKSLFIRQFSQALASTPAVQTSQMQSGQTANAQPAGSKAPGAPTMLNAAQNTAPANPTANTAPPQNTVPANTLQPGVPENNPAANPAARTLNEIPASPSTNSAAQTNNAQQNAPTNSPAAQNAGAPNLVQPSVTENNAAPNAPQANRTTENASPFAAASSQMEVQKAVQTLLSRLSQTPAAERQAVTVITNTIAQQLANPSLSQQAKAEFQPLLENFVQQPATENAKAAFIEQTSQVLLQQAIRQTAMPGLSQTEQNEVRQALLSLIAQPDNRADEALRTLLQAAKDHPQAKQLLQAAESQLAQTLDGSAAKEAIRQIFSTLGLNYEAQLAGKESEAANAAAALKPQLLSMVHNTSLSPQLREAAETMVFRMNGTMIQNSDNGIQQQIIMQLPLELYGSKIDATLQWNGRTKENGQIDPAFARILFYLELETLSTTLVDMHVQNKVVNLTIFNEQPSLRTEGLALQPFLKQQLETAGYKLSGISFKPFNETKPETVSPQYADERGVDYRI